MIDDIHVAGTSETFFIAPRYHQAELVVLSPVGWAMPIINTMPIQPGFTRLFSAALISNQKRFLSLIEQKRFVNWQKGP